MKMTTQLSFNRTKTALAVGVALFAVSELALASYEARTSGLKGTNDTAEVDNAAVTIDVLANDGDADAASLAIGTQPTQGTAAISNGQVVYTPNEGFTGPDTFTYIVQENEWRNDESGAPLVTPYSMAVDATAPIATSYPIDDGSSVPIFNGTFTAPGFWNENPLGNGVVGKSWKPNTSVAQLQGCNAGDDDATPVSLTMTWEGERRANPAQFNPGGNQFTITTDAAPTPVKTDGDGIVLQVFQDSTQNVTSSANGIGSVTDLAGDITNGSAPWKFQATTTWSNLTAAEFEALPITILASTYNSKTWYSTSTTFNATVDYSTCQLNKATVNVTVTAKDSGGGSSGGGGGGGSMDKAALFVLGLFGLNALRRRRQV